MQIGNKIFELRKKQNLSQEQLAFKMKVARQTISKWELGETSPDLEQSKQLSKIFNVSLDELTNNDVKDVLIDKVNNTENMSKTIINILRIILLIVIIIVVVLISSIYFKDYFSVTPTATGRSYECTIDENTYTYEVWYKHEEPQDIIDFKTNDPDLNINYKNYNRMDWLFEAVKTNVTNRGGTCKF